MARLMMRGCRVALVGLTACGRASRPAVADSTAVISGLRDTLVRIGAEDQVGRDSIAAAVANNDSVFMRRLVHADSARSQWLQRVVAAHGWPRRSIVGDTASGAAWLIVQHSPMADFQQAMLPLLEAEARRGEVKAADVAMLFDRIQVDRKQPQRYGTQFSVIGTRLVADSIVGLAGLDSLRASVGLPSMMEYAKLLAQMYRMPVEWPPSSGRMVRQ